MVSTFNNQKFDSSVFNRGAGIYVTSHSFAKWGEVSYSDLLHNFKWNNQSYSDITSILQWNNQVLTSEFSYIFQWINREYLEGSDIAKWRESSYVTPLTTFDWGQRFYWRDLRFNQEKYNKSSFNRGTFYTGMFGDILKWNNLSFTTQDSIIKWNNREFISEISNILKWNEISYNTISSIIKWNNFEFLSISDIIKWNNRVFSSEYSSIMKWGNRVFTDGYSSIVQWNNIAYNASSSIAKWNNREFISVSDIIEWNNISYNTSSSIAKWNNREFISVSDIIEWNNIAYNTSSSIAKWNNISYNTSTGILKWNNVSYDTSSDILKWGNREFTGEYVSNIKWLNRMFISQDSIIKWNNFVFLAAITDILKWNNVNYNTSSSILKWINQAFIESLSIARWDEVCYNTGQSAFIWLNNSGGLFPLSDYLSVKTIQGKYIFPDIIGGNISFKDGSIGEANLELAQFIPEDSRCIFYLKGDARMFDGISRRCVKDGSSGTYKVNILEYNEILKPESGKGGHYLVKNDWHDVELHNLLSSLKPSLNDNEMGLLYIACSAIPNYLFEEHDVTNNIFKFEYTGLPYSITEVFEDVTLLTQRASAAALVTASGWYHDTTAKILYIKCTDNVFPYYHVISVPYIWDFKVPVRIGNISSQASTVIAYWETANGDIPLDTIENLLTALNLEYEPVYRNGYLYIDVSEKIGSGTTTSPANYYNEKDNIISVQEIDMADARNMVNGVGFRGYGSGAGGIISGCHINTGRGGRFILLDDSSVHSQAMADGFVQKYLDDHYLPARSIKFSAPLFVGGAVDQRRLGDTAHISIPSEYLEQDLRVKEVAIKLKPLSQTLTFGDKLISYDDQIKAMRAASEKYRKHLQGEIEEFTWNWSENLDNGANRSNKFTITADALKIQKLELSCSTDLFRADAGQGSGGSGGGGAGDGGSGEPAEKPHTGPGDAHTHTLISGAVGVPSATVAVAAHTHYHVLNALVSSAPSATVSVAASTHYHVLSSLVSGAPSATVSVAASTHYHILSSLISSVPSTTITVAVYNHTHLFTITSAATAAGSIINVASSSHTHAITSSLVATTSFTSVALGTHIHAITSSSAATPTIGDVASSSHTHAITSSLVATTSFTSVALGTHTHVITSSSAATSSFTSVSLAGHTHTVSVTGTPTTSVVPIGVTVLQGTDSTACCTGINCGKQFITASGKRSATIPDHSHTVNMTIGGTTGIPSVDGNVASSSHTHAITSSSAATPTIGDVASSSHTHAITSSLVATTSFTSVALGTHTHVITSSSAATPTIGDVASSSHTHAITSSLVATTSFTSVALGTHTHVVSGTAVATTSSSVSVALGTHTHTTSGNTDVCNAQTTVSTSTHTHTTSGNTNVCNAQTTVSTSTHTHTTSGNTEVCNAQTNTATYNHTHTITALVLANESTHTHEISSDGYNPTLATEEDAGILIDPTTKEPPADWQTNPDKRQKALDMYTFISSPSYPAHSTIDPSMRFKVAISGPGITGSVEIVGSPLLIHINDSFGPILIDNLVKTAGEYTVTVGLTNVDYPADKTHIRFSMQINGIIFCDTIVKS
jgi:hypothetical protein